MNTFRSNGGNAARRIDVLPPERTARRVPEMRRPSDIQDADFEVIPSGFRRDRKTVFNDNCRATKPETGALFRMSSKEPMLARAVGAMEKTLQTASPQAFAVLVTCLCAPVFGLFVYMSHGRPVATQPEPKPAAIDKLTTTGNTHGMKVVSMSGTTENASAVQVEIISNGQKRTIDNVPSDDIAPASGSKRSFVTHIPQTDGKTPSITVSFGNKGDSAL